jgi:hypothetical protein
MLRIPHCLDNYVTDGGEVVSPTQRPRSTLQKYSSSSSSGTRFCQRLSEPQGLVLPEGLGKLKKFIHFAGFRTRDLPACSVVPLPLRCQNFYHYLHMRYTHCV